jgi:hypothetical protein
MNLMTAIAHLLAPCGPAAIAGLVSLIVIDAVEGKPWRRLSHVGKEIFENQPALAYCDPSASPISKSFVFRIAASLLHRRPATIDRRVFGSKAVFEIEVVPRASAASRLASLQVAAGSWFFYPAIASTRPSRASFVAHDNPATEALARDVDGGWHV